MSLSVEEGVRRINEVDVEGHTVVVDTVGGPILDDED